MSRAFRWNLFAFAIVNSVASAATGMTVRLAPSVSSPVPVGTLVTFSANVSDTSGSNLWYRFRVRTGRGNFQMIRDYGPLSSLDWTASEREGSYEMEISVRNVDTGEVATDTQFFVFNPIVTSNQPVISPTANSLVFLYAAPPCAIGGRMRVAFTSADGIRNETPYKTCTPGASMHFYLAGLRADTTYTAQHTLNTASGSITGPTLSFTTGDLPTGLYTDTIVTRGQVESSPILLGSPISGSAVANDLDGNVIWYGPFDTWILTRPEAGGVMWGVVEFQGGTTSQQAIRKIDLTGMTLLETNAARVNEQLRAMGKRQISAFHHEARTLANGNIAVLADVEQMLSNVQGPGPIDIIGDMVIVFDSNLNVVWTWDTFDHLDVTRAAVLGETCPASAGCPPFILAPTANDWTHGNSISETADGNLIYSARHQDWLIKIFYNAGYGDGHIVWKLGQGGDFQINSSDPYPWFSHQHDGSFESVDATKLMVFDDGNTRVTQMQGGNSRGQVLTLDEQNHVATLALNADLGVYSQAVGSAQLLSNGDYHFDAGFIAENNSTVDSHSFEVTPSGQIVYDAHQNVILYRTFRMQDMYTMN